ncbi:MAG: DNA-directed RNA polymerase subunit alpha [Candidatus Dojkabacteria bacterium]|nr:MAG: DNA-directed RNA polymerase subunit alpha [Candidatus Dojkabacteria bacterium]
MVDFKDIKVKVVKDEGNAAQFEISPLPRGYGHTLANSLRRVLLSSLEGAAITSLKVAGIDHEYTTIEGVKEDVVEIILNLKALKFSSTSDEPQIVSLDVSGEKEVTTGDLMLPGGVEVSDNKAHIATLTNKKASLSMELVVERGVGYRTADEAGRSEMGRIPLDADFSPIKNVSFDVTSARKGQKTNLDAVIVEIETDGSIKPIDALLESAKIIQDFAGKVMVALGVPVTEVEEMAQAARESDTAAEAAGEGMDDEVSGWRVEDLPISKRSKSGLLAGGYETVGDLRGVTASDLLALPGFGNKSLNEVLDLMSQYGIEIEA